MSKINKLAISGPANIAHVTHLDTSDIFDTKIDQNSEKGWMLSDIPSVSKFYFEDNKTNKDGKSEAEFIFDSILQEANGGDVLTLLAISPPKITFSQPISTPRQFE
jgi:hypothetical protein